MYMIYKNISLVRTSVYLRKRFKLNSGLVFKNYIYFFFIDSDISFYCKVFSISPISERNFTKGSALYFSFFLAHGWRREVKRAKNFYSRGGGFSTTKFQQKSSITKI